MRMRLVWYSSLILAIVMLTADPVSAQETIEGRWDGAIHVLGQELAVSVSFETTQGGLTATIDIPQQFARGLALTNVRFERPKVHFELQAHPGLAVFDGRLEDETISGDFAQAGVEGTFSLTRAAPTDQARAGGAGEAGEAQRAEGAGREESTSAVADRYREEEVTFDNDREGIVTLAGTLTLPLTGGPHPAVVMITGSGPQNRDEELFGFKPFKIIANHLTPNGVAVLRYDDRGVGGSTGNVAISTSQDFAGDVLAAVRFLRSRKDIDPDKIGLIGHSEGAIVAPLAAAFSKDVAFIVLLAGTAVIGEELLYAQIERLLRLSGATDEVIAARLDFQRRVFAALRTGEGWEAIEEELRVVSREQVESMPADQRDAIKDADAFVETRVKAQLAEIRTPWFRYFIDYDPVPALKEVKVPVLALFGELDVQVPPDVNRDPMERAFEASGHQKYTILVLPGANHFFMAAKTGSPSEYPSLEKQFVPGFLDLLNDWILERTGR